MGACRGLLYFVGSHSTYSGVSYEFEFRHRRSLRGDGCLAVAELNFVVPALMKFFVVAERGVVGYEFRDRHTGHGGCGVITLLYSGVRRLADHYGFAQFVAGCAFETAAAYLEYLCFVQINWSSLRPSDY